MKNLKIRESEFNWGERTYVMGILNVTPDSFSDGGEFNGIEKAIEQVRAMIAAGVDIIDVGGQSTRPNAEEVEPEEELNRVIPIIEAIRAESSIVISLDTTRAIVAEKGIGAGADIINDISGATFDPAMLETVAKYRVPIILMHIKGNPKTMQSLTEYDNLIKDINEFLNDRIGKALEYGIAEEHIIIDPGIGFAKTGEQNLEIIRQLPRFKALGYPVLVGVSRKSFIGKITGKDNPKDRIHGTAAACSACVAGGCDIVRVHDTAEMIDACRVADAIWRI